MAWSKAYNRIIWQNEPSTDTPLNATNLNKMDAALNEIDNRVLQLENMAYVHIKYSAYPSPTNIQMKDTPDAYMGICVTSEETAPTQASAYTWNRVRGEKIMLRSDSGYIQYKYEDDVSWINLIPLSSLKGADGQDGRGIVSIIRTDGDGSPGTYDTFTITYTNGTTSSFQVYNGADGAKGDKGDQGETGRGIVSVERINGDGSPGTFDTYAITYSDGQFTTFQVYNGADGEKGEKGDRGDDGLTAILSLGSNGHLYVEYE